MNVAYNMDCMEAMRTMKDNEFDLAVVDVPYGVERFKGKKGDTSKLRKYGSFETANDATPPPRIF